MSKTTMRSVSVQEYDMITQLRKWDLKDKYIFCDHVASLASGKYRDRENNTKNAIVDLLKKYENTEVEPKLRSAFTYAVNIASSSPDKRSIRSVAVFDEDGNLVSLDFLAEAMYYYLGIPREDIQERTVGNISRKMHRFYKERGMDTKLYRWFTEQSPSPAGLLAFSTLVSAGFLDLEGNISTFDFRSNPRSILSKTYLIDSWPNIFKT